VDELVFRRQHSCRYSAAAMICCDKTQSLLFFLLQYYIYFIFTRRLPVLQLHCRKDLTHTSLAFSIFSSPSYSPLTRSLGIRDIHDAITPYYITYCYERYNTSPLSRIVRVLLYTTEFSIVLTAPSSNTVPRFSVICTMWYPIPAYRYTPNGWNISSPHLRVDRWGLFAD